jgi:Secretion system C-terminal sorting domain
LPVTADVFAYVGSGGAAGVFMPNQFFSLHNATFNGSDNEDQPNTGPLAGKTVKIITASYNVPGTSETGSLYYDGNLISANQIIISYNPLLLKFRLAANTNDPWYLSGYELKFYYSYVDAAGIADPTPATYIVRYPVAAGPLPIVLSDFVVGKNGCNANLYWNTSSEINADKFEVEYSSNTSTAIKTLGSVRAYGNSSSVKNYQFNFEMEAGEVYNLRLKMINKDGTFTYSEIRKLSCINASNDIKISPNPALHAFQINGMLKGKNTITIYNNDGKMISSFNGTNKKDIDISHLQAGVYVVRILNENGTSSVERLIKY